ncbi:MAG: hypothetical protein LW817_03970 [Candidatus Caenarcaniphilales bacterium]|nr:hypothetical protein [Candidatus Caenarcaniphilales bacterium]
MKKLLLIVFFIHLGFVGPAKAFTEPDLRKLKELLQRLKKDNPNFTFREEVFAPTQAIEAEPQEPTQQEQIQETQRLITNGKGIWINIWNYPKDMDKFIARMKKFNIDTIYLQINRSTTPYFYNQTGLNQILKASHENNIKVIGWSYCYLKNISLDADKFIKPALYKSPEGHSLDGMAADIEENTQLWAVKSYTEAIKKKLPNDYPLIAIVFSPKIKQKYPWEYIGNKWDILMPMVYWHGLKNRDRDLVYNFVKSSIDDLRKFTKKDDLNIHLITDGERTTVSEIRTSLEAALDAGVNAGVSIYPEHLSTDSMLEQLKNF